MDIPKDPREAALAAVIRSLLPDGPGVNDYAIAYAITIAHAYAYAHVYAYDRARARANAIAIAPFTPDQQAQIDAAYTLIYG